MIQVPIGFPTYCLVVTITLNVSRITEVMHQWRRNTDESMWTWEILTKVFSLKNISSMIQRNWRSHEDVLPPSPHLFPFYPSEVSEVNKINVLGIGDVSEKVTLVSENMLYVSEILVKIAHNLELF